MDSKVALFMTTAGVWNHCCEVPVRLGTVAALTNSKRIKSCKNMMSLSQHHSERFVLESRNCNESCMLGRCGYLLYGARQIGIIVF